MIYFGFSSFLSKAIEIEKEENPNKLSIFAACITRLLNCFRQCLQHSIGKKFVIKPHHQKEIAELR